MRIIDSHYLADGKGFNDGRPARLIAIESSLDFDSIIDNIEYYSYYGRHYMENNLGYGREKVKLDNLLSASIIDFLEPANLLELGCGKGDIPFFLWLRGKNCYRGLDVSQEILAEAQPEVASCLDCGDLLELVEIYTRQGLCFDTVCGFDIWEHLHPTRLNDYINASVELASEDALFFFIIPAYGQDRVFGEIFPLEFEENRDAFMRRQPFDYMVAEVSDPPIPQSGHLIWAHTEWWEDRFNAHGLVRAVVLEKNIHRYFDGYLNRAARSFFILRRRGTTAQKRVRRLLRHPLTAFRTWQLLHIYLRAVKIYEHNNQVTLIDWEKMLWLEDGALETMLASFEVQLRWPWPLGQMRAWLKNILKCHP